MPEIMATNNANGNVVENANISKRFNGARVREWVTKGKNLCTRRQSTNYNRNDERRRGKNRRNGGPRRSWRKRKHEMSIKLCVYRTLQWKMVHKLHNLLRKCVYVTQHKGPSRRGQLVTGLRMHEGWEQEVDEILRRHTQCVREWTRYSIHQCIYFVLSLSLAHCA